MADAMHVPIAAPAVPKAGIGPNPRMRITFRPALSTVMATPRIIGVRASPAERSAVPSMKNIIMPPLNRNMIRRKGSASCSTAGAALTKSNSHGDTK